MYIAFRSRLLDALRGHDRAQFARDASAGMTVGVVALPLASRIPLRAPAGVLLAVAYDRADWRAFAGWRQCSLFLAMTMIGTILPKAPQRKGGRRVLVAANAQPLSLMRRSGFFDKLGPGACFNDLEQALGALATHRGPHANPGHA